MLVLTRQLNQELVFEFDPDDLEPGRQQIRVMLVAVRNAYTVKLGVKANPRINIFRAELERKAS